MRTNMRHAPKRRMPWSTRLPVALLVVELGALAFAVAFFLLPALQG